MAITKKSLTGSTSTSKSIPSPSSKLATGSVTASGGLATAKKVQLGKAMTSAKKVQLGKAMTSAKKVQLGKAMTSAKKIG